MKKQRGDMVKWRAERGGGPWTITFDKGDGTPFREAVFDVPANGAVVSREVHGTAETKPYRYRVQDGTSPFTETHDPDVDVDRVKTADCRFNVRGIRVDGVALAHKALRILCESPSSAVSGRCRIVFVAQRRSGLSTGGTISSSGVIQALNLRRLA